MSFDLEEAKWDAAEQIALATGLLRKCDCGYVIDQQVSDRTEAYAIASSRFAKGDLQFFGKQKDVTDMIDRVVDDSLSDCDVCLE